MGLPVGKGHGQHGDGVNRQLVGTCRKQGERNEGWESMQVGRDMGVQVGNARHRSWGRDVGVQLWNTRRASGSRDVGVQLVLGEWTAASGLEIRKKENGPLP